MSEPRRKLSISVPRVPWLEQPNRMNDDLPRRDLSDSKGRDNFVKDDTRPPENSPQIGSERVIAAWEGSDTEGVHAFYAATDENTCVCPECRDKLPHG